jgi:hypothetical protein
MTIKKVLTISAVFLAFAWGTILWFTADLILATDLAQLSAIKNGIFLMPLVAPFIRARLQLSDVKLLFGVSALSVVGILPMILFSPGSFAFIAGYFCVATLRIFLMPVLLGFAERNLGETLAVAVLAGGFHFFNAALKPVVAILVEQDYWRYGLWLAVLLVVASAVTAYFAGDANAEARLMRTPNPRLLGKGVIVFVGIQIVYGIREIAVFPLAENVLGSITDAGVLEGIGEAAMFASVFLTFLLRPGVINPMLTVQAVSSIAVIAAIKLHNPHVLYVAKIAEGISHAVLERVSEIIYVGLLGGLPTAGVAWQWIDTLGRVGTVPGRIVAAELSLEFVTASMAVLSVVTLILAMSPLSEWVGNRLYKISGLNFRFRLLMPKQLQAQLEQLRSNRIR